MKLSGIAIRPLFGSRACVATTESRSDPLRTGAEIASTAKEAAAALKEFSQYSAYGADAGLNSIATLAIRGTVSFSSSNHLPVCVGSERVKPVTLPPGRGKLTTRPLPIGSLRLAKTMGMVRVCCSSAVVAGVVFETMTSGWSATSSFANRCIAAASVGAAQRVSSRMLLPSVHPSLRSPSRNAATWVCTSASLSA